MPVYLKFDDIKGDVTDRAHSGWIELTSVQLGAGKGMKSSQPSGREGESPAFTDIAVTKKLDSASTLLFQQSLSGRGVSALIDLVDKDGWVYLRLELTDTMISSYNVGGQGTGPTESLTLNFAKVEVKDLPGILASFFDLSWLLPSSKSSP
jgi:type VI secretion system secreted protein Hcp